MNKIKKYIIITILILLVLILIIIKINSRSKISPIDPDSGPQGLTNEENTKINDMEKMLKIETNRNTFYEVKNCVIKFYMHYMDLFDKQISKMAVGEKIESQKSENENLYNMLDKEYIEANDITVDNISSKLSPIKQSFIDISKMYVEKKTDNIYVYIVTGTLREKVSGNTSNIQIMVKIDTTNKTFKVLLEDYISKKYTNIQLGEQIDIKIDNTIENNSINIYNYEIISDENYIEDIFEQYKDDFVYNKQEAYNKLNEEYKNSRFSSFENFDMYINNNIKSLIIAKIDKYQKTIYPEYTQYICIDNKGNYYIFREKSVMNYTVILDQHTIDLPEFIEKYNNASNENKVAMNTEKIKDALNTKDYKYVYEKLDTTFKQNNFPSQENLEQFINNKLFETNKFEYTNIEEKSGIYIFTLNVSDYTGKDTRIVKLNIIMQLEEGTDFVMSFSVE